MRKLKIKFFLLAAFTVGFFGCQKEEVVQEPQQIINEEINFRVVSEIPYDNISVENISGKSAASRILVFRDMRSFVATMNDLERQVETLDNAFIDQYADLNEDEINDMEDRLRFNEEQPLIDFERRYRFSSLRKKIDALEEIWLNNEELDLRNDPDNHFIDENALRTLLNENEEVVIGRSIYKFTDRGYIEISGRSFETLSQLDVQNINANDLPENVKLVGDFDANRAEGCHSSKRNSGYKTSGNKRIKWVISHWTHPWGRRAMAKTKNYKKRGNRWKKRRSYCFATVGGSVSGSDGNCDSSVNFNPGGGYASHGNKKKIKHSISVQTKTLSGWMNSGHSGIGGISHTRTLTFN